MPIILEQLIEIAIVSVLCMDTLQQALSTSLKTSVAYQALELAEGRVIELTSSLAGAQRQFECAEKHRDLVTRQLNAQKEDYGKLGRQLQKVVPLRIFNPPQVRSLIAVLFEVPTALQSLAHLHVAPGHTPLHPITAFPLPWSCVL